MANQEQVKILKQGIGVWNQWRSKNLRVDIDLSEANLSGEDLRIADLREANLNGSDLHRVNLSEANLRLAQFQGANFVEANLTGANFTQANLACTNLSRVDLNSANLRECHLKQSVFLKAELGGTIFGYSDLSAVIGLDSVFHSGPSSISTDAFALSKGKIPDVFLRGCGLSDWEIESVKLYNPDLSNNEKNSVLYKMYDLLAGQALQISPLFISYSHGDSTFVDQLERCLNEKGVRFWRDVHHATSGRLEKQIDHAMRLNPTVLLILSEQSTKSDWVEHEVRTARQLEKEMGHDVLCPIALDDSWKNSLWPKRVMEQVMEFNILDFSAWKDDDEFRSTFNKLIDGLGLFYKG